MLYLSKEGVSLACGKFLFTHIKVYKLISCLFTDGIVHRLAFFLHLFPGFLVYIYNLHTFVFKNLLPLYTTVIGGFTGFFLGCFCSLVNNLLLFFCQSLIEFITDNQCCVIRYGIGTDYDYSAGEFAGECVEKVF